MVDHVQIVEQEEEGKRTGVLDDDGALANIFRRLMLDERADQQDRHAEIGRCRELPDWHWRDCP